MSRVASQIIEDYIEQNNAEEISLGEIVQMFEVRGVAFLTMLFALPPALPLPAVGVATLFSIPCFLMIFYMLVGGRKVVLPKAVAERKFSKSIMQKIVGMLKFLEHLSWARLEFLSGQVASKIVAIFALFFIIIALIPVPLTNTVPCLAIVLMMFGIFQRDGLFVLLGLLVGILWTGLLTLGLYYAGAEFVDWVRNFI